MGSSNSMDYELKNAHDVLVGSLSAAINFCRHFGVPKPAGDQLERNLKARRYYAVMIRLQDYITCLQSENDDDLLAKIHLSVSTWEAMCRYKHLLYKRAYKTVFRLRDGVDVDSDENSSTVSVTTHDNTKKKKGIIKSSIANIRSKANHQKEIEKAMERQVRIAEQCTSCQKKLYLVKRWEKQVLRRLNKAATIEPEGSQPIRCIQEKRR